MLFGCAGFLRQPNLGIFQLPVDLGQLARLDVGLRIGFGFLYGCLPLRNGVLGFS